MIYHQNSYVFGKWLLIKQTFKIIVNVYLQKQKIKNCLYYFNNFILLLKIISHYYKLLKKKNLILQLNYSAL